MNVYQLRLDAKHRLIRDYQTKLVYVSPQQLQSVLDAFDILEPENKESISHIDAYARLQLDARIAETQDRLWAKWHNPISGELKA